MILKIKKEKTRPWWVKTGETITTEFFVIDKPTEGEAFADYFRNFENEYKHCNDLQFSIVNEQLAAAYRAWLGNAFNYASNGGDML